MLYIVVAAAVVLALGLLRWLAMRHRDPCPFCGEKAIQTVGFFRATIVIDGQRAPDSWTYCECDLCGKQYKDHRGQIEITSEAEWQRHAFAKQPDVVN